MSLNIFQLVIIFGVLQGIIYSAILLFFKPVRSTLNKILTLLIFCIMANLLQYWLFDVQLIGRSILELIFLPWQILIPPLFLFYLLELTQADIELPPLKLIFFPVVILFGFHLILKIFMLSGGLFNWEKNAFVSWCYKTEEIITIIYGACISIFALYYILCQSKIQNIHFYEHKLGMIKWLKNLIYFSLLICTIWFLSHTYLHVFNGYGMETYYLLWILMSLTISFLGIPGIYYSYKSKYVIENRNAFTKTKDLGKHQITGDNLHYKKLENLLNDVEIITNPHLDLNLLAKKLGISAGYVSKLIHVMSSKHFNEFINEKRITYVKVIMANPKYKDYNVMGYGYEAGFNSKSTFYKAFKAIENVSPGEYLKQYKFSKVS